MSALDLTSQQTVKTVYNVDTLTGFITVTFTDGSGTVLGTVKVEAVRYRSLVDALDIVAKELYGDTSPGLVGQRTIFDKNSNRATTVFG